VPNHSEIDFEDVAGVSDIGKRHHYNEDAMGLAVLPGVAVAVVCDGVSTSSRPDEASAAGVKAATTALARMLDPTATANSHGTERAPEDAMVAAISSAQAAVVDTAGALSANPPSTTLVAVAVHDRAITVGWIGDSRVYWLPEAATPGEPACLTIDDTLGGQLAAAGVELIEVGPNLGALVRWLGADAIDPSAHVQVFSPPGPGRLVVCSDGLYRYAPDPTVLAAITPVGPPMNVARELVRFALDEGGHDNVTVVVVTYPPAESR
jgi:serine/threonine protein phosphatase PrpC